MKLKSVAANFVGGFAIGTTDLIPGFSGATTALILGYYERLLKFIAGILVAIRRPRLFKKLDWGFIIPLAVGSGVAILSMARLMVWLLKKYPEEMAGFFCGLALVAILGLLRLIQIQSLRQMAICAVTAISVGILFFWLLGLESSIQQNLSLWVYFGAGALASVGLILPGISGAFILLMIGFYTPALNAVSDFEILTLASLGLGVLVGLVFFGFFLNILIAKFRTYVLAILTGLLIGSFRVLWPWPDGVGIIDRVSEKNIVGTKLELPSFGEFWLPALLGLLTFLVGGFLLITALQLNRANK